MRYLLFILAFSLAATTAQAALVNTPQPVMPGEPPPSDQAPAPSDVPAVVEKPAFEKPIVKKPAAEAGAKAASLSPQDKNDIERIEQYLNGLKSISANFVQVDDHGNFRRGAIDIQRPGKMRVVYAPPSKDFIVADGDMVHIWDGGLKSQTNVPESASLANFILRDPIKLGGDVTIIKYKRFPAKLELTLAQTSDPGLGQLTLIFEDHPLLLRQWRVLDAEERTTGVNLENERMDVAFEPNTFSFVPPSFGKAPKGP